MAVAAPIEQVHLHLKHTNTEDWVLHLPLKHSDGDTVEGEARCVIRSGAKTIEFAPVSQALLVEDNTIKMSLPSSAFDGHEGTYVGDILLKLTTGFDCITHTLKVDIQKGVTPRW